MLPESGTFFGFKHNDIGHQHENDDREEINDIPEIDHPSPDRIKMSGKTELTDHIGKPHREHRVQHFGHHSPTQKNQNKTDVDTDDKTDDLILG